MAVAHQLRQSCHFSKITIGDWFEMFLVFNSIIIITKVNHDYLLSILKIFTYQTSFREILTRAFSQYIKSEKKLGSFSDLINACFQSFICLPLYEHFLASIFYKVSLGLLNRIQPILERLKENITKP